MSREKETEKVEKDLTILYGLKPLSLREKAGDFLRFLLILFIANVVVAVSIFLTSYLVMGLFPEYVPIQSANDLLKILIEADGILLGFSGIIVAQLLSSIMDQQNTLYQSILEKPEKASDKAKSLEFLDRRKFVLSLTACFTFIFLVLSILFSMANIAKNSNFKPTDTYSSFAFLFGPLFEAVVAIALLVVCLTGLPMKPPLENIRTAT